MGKMGCQPAQFTSIVGRFSALCEMPKDNQEMHFMSLPENLDSSADFSTCMV
jgi:hypothetical protein